MFSIVVWTIYCAIAQVWDESDIGNMHEEQSVLEMALWELHLSLEGIS